VLSLRTYEFDMIRRDFHEQYFMEIIEHVKFHIVT